MSIYRWIDIQKKLLWLLIISSVRWFQRSCKRQRYDSRCLATFLLISTLVIEPNVEINLRVRMWRLIKVFTALESMMVMTTISTAFCCNFYCLHSVQYPYVTNGIDEHVSTFFILHLSHFLHLIRTKKPIPSLKWY